jgi:hypothetical protein
LQLIDKTLGIHCVRSPVESGVAITVAVVVIIIAVRLAMGGLDRSRVSDYVTSRGGRLLDARWTPFGPGWLGDKTDRIYEVTYVDVDGNEHVAHCKTSMLTGVYFTEDRITRNTQATSASPSFAALEDENRRLREEVARLKSGKS